VARWASAAVRPAAARARLLIADDNKVNRLLLGRTLELQGHHISSVDNGREALDRLRRERFDLLLLDLEMPEMDGFAVLEQLAADLALRELPVIVTSSIEGVPQVARCIELGADDFLHKPVNPVLLKARVGSCLEKKRLRDQQKELIERYATGAMTSEDPQQAGVTLGGQRLPATVLCTRLRDFTAYAEAQPPEETIELLNIWYTLMFDAVASQNGAVNRMSGDGLMAVFGAPMPPANPGDAPLAAVRAALDMVEMLEIFNAERAVAGRTPLAIGMGIATGDVIAGTTGTPQRAAYTCVGETVNAAAALESLAASSTRAILIDETTRAAVAGRVATDTLTAAEVRGKKHAAAVHAVRTS
jgi:class 3 adenylate cyclase